jgi:hypothetical protein
VLPAKLGVRVPTRIEEDEQRFDAVARRDVDKLRKSRLEATLILGPELVVQKHPDTVESIKPRPAEFGIDARGIEGVALKHLELIDGV